MKKLKLAIATISFMVLLLAGIYTWGFLPDPSVGADTTYTMQDSVRTDSLK